LRRIAGSTRNFPLRIQQFHPDDLYVAEYEGLYCTGCEEFKQESQIVNGHCIEHPTLELIRTRERNHFFRLSRYRDPVLDLIRSGKFLVEPAIRRNEVLRLLEGGLQDISVSRLRQPWGIPFPADPEQTVYVWFDALINYLSATGFPDAGYERLWPADLHVIGKGITRFHCVIWPAMLLSAQLDIPREVWAHGYVQWEGTKQLRWTKRSSATVPIRCGTSCSAKWVSSLTATSPGNASTSDTPPTWPMVWAISPPEPSPCCRSTGMESCPDRLHRRHWI
jgi:hypothetical protein